MNPFVGFANYLKDQHWQNDAACAEIDPTGTRWHDPEIFFPNSGYDTSRDARRVCNDCPVIQECLDFALRNNEPHGIWGGQTFEERKRTKRKQPPHRPGHCHKGHDMTIVGIDSARGCAQCRKDRITRYDQRRRQGLVAPRRPKARRSA